MKRSKSITLLLCSSIAIYGVGNTAGCDQGHGYYDEDGNWIATTYPVDEYDSWEPEPAYVGGVMGVYDPVTLLFVPHTSPAFHSTCMSIRSSHVSAVRAGAVSSVRGGFGAMGGKAGIAT